MIVIASKQLFALRQGDGGVTSRCKLSVEDTLLVYMRKCVLTQMFVFYYNTIYDICHFTKY